MKRLLVIFGIALVAGIVVLVALNAIGFKPLDLQGDDPNSNAMLVAIVYFVVAAVMFGTGSRAARGTVIDMTAYARTGASEDQKAFDYRFPVAAVAVVNGIVFVVLYFVMNSRI